MAKTETKAAKMRTYQVLAIALVEERKLGLINEAEFTKRSGDLWEQVCKGEKA